MMDHAVPRSVSLASIVRSLSRGCGIGMTILLASCATTSTHQFAEPARDWQTRTGQLLYRNPTTTVIGDFVVRFSKNGDFELTFSKGPGLTLLILRQDSNFAEVSGPLAGRGWSAPIDRAPQQLRGWLELRDKVIHSGKDRHQVRHVSGSETFVFRF
jgi:hypothetical protein